MTANPTTTRRPAPRPPQVPVRYERPLYTKAALRERERPVNPTVTRYLDLSA